MPRRVWLLEGGKVVMLPHENGQLWGRSFLGLGCSLLPSVSNMRNHKQFRADLSAKPGSLHGEMQQTCE